MPPTFKADDKKPISVKAPVSITKTVGTTASSSARTTKKGINMGAASNYGKNSELGINSPTHRNTHNEDLFGTSDTSNVSVTKTTSSIIEDIFNDASDDFNPRAEEPVPKASGDFGDFESAFGNEPQAPKLTSSTVVTAKPVVDSDFADFSSAFDSSQASSSQQSTAIPLDNDNFLFSSSPQPIATTTAMPQTSSTNNNLLSADLFGNSVLTSAFTASQASSNKDLLSDFGDLTLNPTTHQGEFTVHA